MGRRSYPSDVTDEEWALVAPYLTLMREDAPQREYPLREMFNALRYVVRTGIPWRWLPNDFPPGKPSMPRPSAGCGPECLKPWSTTCAFSCESSRGGTPIPQRSSWTPGPCPPPRRAGTGGIRWGQAAGEGGACGGGHPGAPLGPGGDAGGGGGRGAGGGGGTRGGVELVVVRLPEARRGFVLLPRRWVVEGSFAWLTRFRRLVRDYERLPQTLAGLHFVAFAMLLAQRLVELLKSLAASRGSDDPGGPLTWSSGKRKGRGAGGRRAPHPLHLLERGAGTPRLRPG